VSVSLGSPPAHGVAPSPTADSSRMIKDVIMRDVSLNEVVEAYARE
jgi:hypothetical protein